MPANLSPEYKKAEQAYRAAREPRERLELLKEMLRSIPKHKGTEHLQADIKSRIKQLTDELALRVGDERAGHPLLEQEIHRFHDVGFRRDRLHMAIHEFAYGG